MLSCWEKPEGIKLWVGVSLTLVKSSTGLWVQAVKECKWRNSRAMGYQQGIFLTVWGDRSCDRGLESFFGLVRWIGRWMWEVPWGGRAGVGVSTKSFS